MRGSHLALLMALSLGACSVYDSSLLKQLGSGAGGNGNGGSSGGDGNGGNGQSGGANGGAGGSGVCGHATFPLPPDPSSVITPGGNIEIVGIMSKIELGDAPPNATIPPTEYLNLGFDLDNRCTQL